MATVQTASMTSEIALGRASATAHQISSAAPLVGTYEDTSWTNRGSTWGGSSSPPRMAIGKNSSCDTAMAALEASRKPTNSPISMNGTTPAISAPSPSSSRPGVIAASVNSAATTSTGIVDRSITASVDRIRPADRGSGPAGRVRRYGFQGSSRSCETELPSPTSAADMAPKNISEPVAVVAATGSRPANGTTNASIEMAGKNALARMAIGTLICSISR
ncbi:hypothetical protein GCM10009733_100150 [Nonomuraea maheshkhaliensis]|uniref:Uncharacterized protein n=1 Tax=Nonomuraea maheshkhaliensis TaxID=419590 RepID=A0ABP4TG27_9ACTN